MTSIEDSLLLGGSAVGFGNKQNLILILIVKHSTRNNKILICIYLTLHHSQDLLIFKWRNAGLNLEVSFSQTGCLIKAKEPKLSYYLPTAGVEQMDSCLRKGMNMKCK